MNDKLIFRDNSERVTIQLRAYVNGQYEPDGEGNSIQVLAADIGEIRSLIVSALVDKYGRPEQRLAGIMNEGSNS